MTSETLCQLQPISCHLYVGISCGFHGWHVRALCFYVCSTASRAGFNRFCNAVYCLATIRLIEVFGEVECAYKSYTVCRCLKISED